MNLFFNKFATQVDADESSARAAGEGHYRNRMIVARLGRPCPIKLLLNDGQLYMPGLKSEQQNKTKTVTNTKHKAGTNDVTPKMEKQFLKYDNELNQ